MDIRHLLNRIIRLHFHSAVWKLFLASKNCDRKNKLETINYLVISHIFLNIFTMKLTLQALKQENVQK